MGGRCSIAEKICKTSWYIKHRYFRDDDTFYDALITAKNRYFELAHTVQEEVIGAPMCLKVRP